jgi:hypothetical protein
MIQFLGRKDQQVKVHGQRVEVLQVEFELGEALYASMPDKSGVKPPCAVMAIPSNQHLGSYRLIAFVEMKPDVGATSAIADSMKQTLRHHMSKTLIPGHIPEAFIGVPSLPRLVNGKLDRVALKHTAVELAGNEDSSAESGVSEELDSFGQVRRTLVEHINGRRIVGTVSTCALALAVLSHWAFTSDKNVIVQMASGWSQEVAFTLCWRVKIISNVMASVGALHGMGDQTKFRFSLWEPCAIAAWLIVHYLANGILAPSPFYLYVLPQIILGRIWVISWQAALRRFGLSNTPQTDAMSMSMALVLYMYHPWAYDIRTFVLHWNHTHDVKLPYYDFFDLSYIVAYLFGFYVLPQLVKKPTASRSAKEVVAFLGLFCIGLINLTRKDGDQFTDMLIVFVELAAVVGVMGLMACMPERINLTMPGLAQFVAYVSFEPVKLWVINGVGIFGVSLFPSLRDLLWSAGKLPPPIDGMSQLMVMVLYVAGYLFLSIGLYSLVSAGASKTFAFVQRLQAVKL